MLALSTAELGIDLGHHVASGGVDFLEAAVPLLAILMVFGTPVVIVLAVLRHRASRQKSINEMVLKLADRGQPIPPELFLEPGKRRRSEVSSGLSLVGAGIGLMGFFWIADAREAIGLGFVPLMIGIGQLIAWKIEQGRRDA